MLKSTDVTWVAVSWRRDLSGGVSGLDGKFSASLGLRTAEVDCGLGRWFLYFFRRLLGEIMST